MTPFGDVAEASYGFNQRVLMAAYRCDECSFLSLAFRGASAGSHLANTRHHLEQQPTWLPAVGASPDFPDVPEDIAAAASEAYGCQSIGAHRGAVMLARSVIEATAKAKGFTTGLLFHKIEAMFKAGLVREHVKDAAHEVRHLGNDTAHGDFVEPVTEEAADEVLQLMSEVLDEVFQSPARVQRRRQARLDKEASKAVE
jgi:hypothetical protein